MPMPSALAFLTDEHSGEEYNVTLQNLPGSQLRADAEIDYRDDSCSDEEDNTPLSQLSKVRRTESEDFPNTASSSAMNALQSRCNTVQPTVSKSQRYTWQNRHTPNEYEEWHNDQGPRYLQPPMYYLAVMLDENIYDLLVNYTNIYACQKNKMGNVTASEMKCFLGILLFSGYVVLPRRSMYWEKAADIDFSLVYSAMSRDRFNFIMSHLHCCDNTQISSSNDKFCKLRPLIDLLNRNFLEMAPLEENNGIDKAMVPYYGGHSCKQFIRGKPIRSGHKLWVGTTRVGYVLWFDPHLAHSTTLPPPYKQFGLGASVILQFADVLQSKQPNLPFHFFFIILHQFLFFMS